MSGAEHVDARVPATDAYSGSAPAVLRVTASPAELGEVVMVDIESAATPSVLLDVQQARMVRVELDRAIALIEGHGQERAAGGWVAATHTARPGISWRAVRGA